MHDTQTNSNKCFCGSGVSFVSCCLPFITIKQSKRLFPQTPEQLMRSRFSAYAKGNSQYIYDTYAKSSQATQSVKEIHDWGQACTWIALQIHSSHSDVLEKTNNAIEQLPEQFVEFSAFYISDDTLFELRENSRFTLETVSETGAETTTQSKTVQWRYLDGDIIKHEALLEIKRKALCPCNFYPSAWSVKAGKKFKQCCGKST